MLLDLRQISSYLAGIWYRQGGGSLGKGWNSLWLLALADEVRTLVSQVGLGDALDHRLGLGRNSGGTGGLMALVGLELVILSSLV